MACNLEFNNCNVIATSITQLIIQTPFVMFDFVFKYRVKVTSVQAFMDQNPFLFSYNNLHFRHLFF